MAVGIPLWPATEEDVLLALSQLGLCEWPQDEEGLCRVVNATIAVMKSNGLKSGTSRRRAPLEPRLGGPLDS
jgi:hypothetical protein